MPDNMRLAAPEPTAQRPAGNSYDEVPYESHPYAQTHPSRLATVATLFGLTPPPVAKCRVLELGCAAGGNIVPMAELLPESEFVGIDLSGQQIADGERIVRATGLSNVSLRHASILDCGRSLWCVRLHHLPRGLLVGAGRRSREDSRYLLEASDAEWHRIHLLQHIPRLAHARHDPRHDAVSCLALRYRRHARAAGPRTARLPRAIGPQRWRRVLDAAPVRTRESAPSGRPLPLSRAPRGGERPAVLSPVRGPGRASTDCAISANRG